MLTDQDWIRLSRLKMRRLVEVVPPLQPLAVIWRPEGDLHIRCETEEEAIALLNFPNFESEIKAVLGSREILIFVGPERFWSTTIT